MDKTKWSVHVHLQAPEFEPLCLLNIISEKKTLLTISEGSFIQQGKVDCCTANRGVNLN